MFLVFDIETSGKSPNKHSIIQLACLKVNGDFNIIDEFNEYCQPFSFKYWDEESQAIHGITRERCEQFQSGMAMLLTFKKFLRQEHFLGICHAAFRENKNKFFDYEFLRNHCLLYNQFHEVIYGNIQSCNSTILRKSDFDMLHNVPAKQNLKSWAEFLGHGFDHHNALDDCHATLKVLKHLVGQGVSFNVESNY